MTDDPLFLLLMIGLGLQVLGFTLRDELALRVVVGAGLCFDIAFYALRAEPIWISVGTNALLVLVNLVLVVFVLLERTTFGMTKRDQTLFEQFRTLSPGQFRRINRLGLWHIADTEREILREDSASDQLFYVDGKTFWIEKRGTRYDAAGPSFLGEIMFLRGGSASASVILPAGTLYIVWQVTDLKRLMARNKALENALIARFSLDLADKVAQSVPLPGAPKLV